MRINDLLLEATHPLFETVLPSYHPTVKLGEDIARVLTEAALTADQINALFQQVQKQVSAGGGNRTVIGKGVDAAVTVKKAYDYVKQLAQDSGPVSGFDSAFDKVANELKNATGGDQGVMKYIQKYRDFAKAHPIAQKVIYSTLVLGAGIAAYGALGPAGIALKPAIIGTMKFTDKLLQGEKFSSAAVAGLETFAAAEIMSKVGAAVKAFVGGGTATGLPKPATGAGAAADAGVTRPDDEMPWKPQPGGPAYRYGDLKDIRADDPDPVSTPKPAAEPTATGPKGSELAAQRDAEMRALSAKVDAQPETPRATPTKSPTLPKSFSGPGTINPTTNQWEPYTVKPQGIAPANIADISPEDLKKGNFPGPKTFDTTTNQWKPLTSPTATPDTAPATTTEPTKAAAPKLSKDFSLASNALGGDVFDAVNDDPKAKRVIDYLTKDLNVKFSQVAPGKLGSDVLQNIQKDLLKQVNSLYPDDAELVLNAQQKKELVYQLMARAQDSFVESSPRLFSIVSDTTNNLFDKISSGSIKTEIELDKFIRKEIISQNPELKNSPGVISILHQKADSVLQSIYSDALDADPKFSKNPEWKVKAIQQWLSKKESVNFSRPALTEAQVMEAFRGTMFHKDTLTEAQVRRLFQHISEGPWDSIKQAGSAIAGSKIGQATAKATGAVARQIGVTAGNLTNKVTADKLNKAWQASGSPMDSAAIYKFLKQQGVDDVALNAAFKAAKIRAPRPSVAVSPQYKQVSSMITKLQPVDRQKLIDYLQKQLGSEPAVA